MSDTPPPEVRPVAEIQASLATIAGLLREARPLTRQAQAELADLIDELGRDLGNPILSESDLAELGRSTRHLAEVVHQGSEPGMLSSARAGLNDAIARVETQAPFAAGIGRRLIDILSDFGI